MDQLTANQAKNLCKTTNERLRLMAACTGDVDDEALMTTDRTSLLQVVAEDMVAKMEAKKGATSRRTSQRSDRMTDAELQLEMKCLEMEDRRMEMEERQLEREIENERAKQEHDYRRAQVGSEHGEDVAMIAGDDANEIRMGKRRGRAETLADCVKCYGSALKQIVTPMSNDPPEIPQFFENLEAMFGSFEIPVNLHAKLLLPFLSQKVRVLTVDERV